MFGSERFLIMILGFLFVLKLLVVVLVRFFMERIGFGWNNLKIVFY